MRHLYRLIILFSFLFSSGAHALSLFLDALYWQADESIDWVAINNLDSTNQQITYKTISFNYRPGFRIGIAQKGDWDTRLFYTRYTTRNRDSATGNVTSAFLAARIVLIPITGGSYQAEQVNFMIDFNMFNWDIGKQFSVNKSLTLQPLVGIQGGSIHQTINTDLQGSISVTESIKNNFSGLGPKAGINTRVALPSFENYQLNLIAEFAASFLWGKWVIDDYLVHHPRSAGDDVDIGVNKRNYGALAIQAFIGGELDYRKFKAKLGYEINDWFNQFQVFDNATGAHDNDLILQGLTLSLSYDIN